MKWVVPILGVIVVIVVLIIVDVARSGPSRTAGPGGSGTGTCVLIRRIMLPDICSCTAAGGASCPVATTRPYAIFWTQAANCATPTSGCARLGSRKSRERSVAAVASPRTRCS